MLGDSKTVPHTYPGTHTCCTDRPACGQNAPAGHDEGALPAAGQNVPTAHCSCAADDEPAGQ